MTEAVACEHPWWRLLRIDRGPTGNGFRLVRKCLDCNLIKYGPEIKLRKNDNQD